MAIIEFPGEPSRNGYSHVVVVPPGSRLIYTAGQVPIGEDGSTPDGWEAQTRLVFQNLGSVLAQAGANASDPNTLRVPNFRGKTVREVMALASQAGVPVVLAGSGIVNYQMPLAGEVLLPGQKVKVTFVR